MDLNILEKVKKSKIPKTITTKVDEFTQMATKAFDYEFEGTSTFFPFEVPSKIPKEFNIGVIVGASGSGKSTLLNEFGEEEVVAWDNEKAIVSHFDTPEIAMRRLGSVGLNSIPTWAKPFFVLSNGEQFRANLSRRIKDNAVIDEFTSVVDRNVAKATSVSISKHIKKNDIKNVVFASCHSDIIEWLEPDWIFDANDGTLYDGRGLRRPSINVEIFSIEKDIWRMFEKHHYLDAKLNKAARCYGAIWDGELVGFTAVLPMPSGTIKNAWREHRTVILPDYQGMGLGVALSDAIASMYIVQGLKYYSRSAHPRFGYHRNNSNNWKSTSTSGKLRKNINDQVGQKHKENNPNWKYDDKRVCFSHEYVYSDYFAKKHFYVLFDIGESKLTYETFKKVTLRLLENRLKNEYVEFISGRPGKEDTYAERLAKELGLRQQNFPSDKKLDGKISKICQAIISINGEHKLKEKCEIEGVRFKEYIKQK